MSSEYLSLLSIFPATKDQILESRKRTCVQWGRGLTIEQYLRRESQLDIAEHAQDGRFATWVLAPRDDPKTLGFECSCETYRRKGLVKRSGSGAPEEDFGYGIASVFTPSQNRGKGYARRMMSLLHWVLAPHSILPSFPSNWGQPPPEREGHNNGRFSVLYSDVGDFYRLAGPSENTDGWIVRNPYSTTWEVSKSPEVIKHPKTDDRVRWLSENNCAELLERDAELMRSSFPLNSKAVSFTFLPNEGVALFQVRRTVYFNPGQTYAIPSNWGLELFGEDQLTFATWTLDVRPPPPAMLVTRIRATKDSFPAILANMLAAARENEMEILEIWNLPKELEGIAKELGGRTEKRDEHLNAFKWYGPENSEDIHWAHNEKFAWC